MSLPFGPHTSSNLLTIGEKNFLNSKSNQQSSSNSKKPNAKVLNLNENEQVHCDEISNSTLDTEIYTHFLNDKTFFSENDQNLNQYNQSITDSCLSAFFKIFKFCKLNKSKQTINFVFLIIYLLNFMILSLELMTYIISKVKFNNEFKYLTILQFYKKISIIFSIFDIIIQLNTFYHENKNIISDKKIMIKYIKNFFINDCISIIPFLSFIIYPKFPSDLSILNIFYLANIKKILLKEKEIKSDVILKNKFWYKILKLIIKFLLITHICALILLFIGHIDINEKNWMFFLKINDDSIENKYFNSLYFAIGIILRAGCGDIIAQNNIEKIFFMILMLIGYYFLILCFKKIVVNFVFKNYIIKSKNDKFDLILNRNEKFLDNEFKRKMLNYHNFIIRQRNDLKFQNKILYNLGNEIKNEYFRKKFKDFLNSIPLFEHFSEECLNEISQMIKIKNLLPNEIIEKENDLIYIEKGEIEIFIKNELNNKKIVSYPLKEKECFNLEHFFTNFSNKFIMKSVGNSICFIIEREKFIKCIKTNYKTEYELFCLEKDQLTFFDPNKYSCLFCKKYGNKINKCNLLHFIPKNKLINNEKRIILDKSIQSCKRTTILRKQNKNQRKIGLIYKESNNKINIIMSKQNNNYKISSLIEEIYDNGYESEEDRFIDHFSRKRKDSDFDLTSFTHLYDFSFDYPANFNNYYPRSNIFNIGYSLKNEK